MRFCRGDIGSPFQVPFAGFDFIIIFHENCLNSCDGKKELQGPHSVSQQKQGAEAHQGTKMNLFCFSLEGSMESIYEPIPQQAKQESACSRSEEMGQAQDKLFQNNYGNNGMQWSPSVAPNPCLKAELSSYRKFRTLKLKSQKEKRFIDISLFIMNINFQTKTVFALTMIDNLKSEQFWTIVDLKERSFRKLPSEDMIF
ncbi:hypothetical protein STEG23_023451, partial [Scotinomys teguina]